MLTLAAIWQTSHDDAPWAGATVDTAVTAAGAVAGDDSGTSVGAVVAATSPAAFVAGVAAAAVVAAVEAALRAAVKVSAHPRRHVAHAVWQAHCASMVAPSGPSTATMSAGGTHAASAWAHVSMHTENAPYACKASGERRGRDGRWGGAACIQVLRVSSTPSLPFPKGCPINARTHETSECWNFFPDYAVPFLQRKSAPRIVQGRKRMPTRKGPEGVAPRHLSSSALAHSIAVYFHSRSFRCICVVPSRTVLG